MRRRIAQLAILAVALVALGSCGGGGGSGPGPATGSGTFQANIDGQPWASDAGQLIVSNTSTPAVPGSLLITGSRLASTTSLVTLRLALAFIGAPGTYPLGVNVVTVDGVFVGGVK